MYLEGKKRVRFLMSAKQFNTGATFLISTSEDFPVLDIVPRAGYVARLEKQKDLSYMLCLNYCHLCDYLLGGNAGCCGRGTKEREVVAKISHFFKQYRGMNQMSGSSQQLQYRCVNVYIPSISRTGKRKIWCPRSFRLAHNDRIGNEVDVNTAIALDREMESYTLFKNKTPEWSDQLSSLVVKFQGNRILTASARNFLLCASSLHNSPNHAGPKSTSSIYYYSDEEDEQYAPPPKSPYERRLVRSNSNVSTSNTNPGPNFITIQAIQRGASSALAANGGRVRRSSSSFDSTDGNAAVTKSKSRSRTNSSIGTTPKTSKRKSAAAPPTISTIPDTSHSHGIAGSKSIYTNGESDGVWIGASSPVSSTTGTTTTATSIGSFDSPAAPNRDKGDSLLKRTLSLNLPGIKSLCLLYPSSVTDIYLFSYLDEEEPILQFGKSSPTRFILDFKYPLSPLQAFGIALASFATDEPSLQRNPEGKEANYRVRGFSGEDTFY